MWCNLWYGFSEFTKFPWQRDGPQNFNRLGRRKPREGFSNLGNVSCLVMKLQSIASHLCSSKHLQVNIPKSVIFFFFFNFFVNPPSKGHNVRSALCMRWQAFFYFPWSLFLTHSSTPWGSMPPCKLVSYVNYPRYIFSDWVLLLSVVYHILIAGSFMP